MLVIDLCSGLGGFSYAFTPDYEIVKIDIDKRLKPTIVADVRHLPLKKNLEPDVLLASPPCNHFSLACLQFPRVGVKLALELVGACFEAVAWLKPKKWLIENPRGRLRGIIGKPKQTIRYSDYDLTVKMMKHTDLWGNIPLPMPKHERRIKRSGTKDNIQRLHENFPSPHSSKYHKQGALTDWQLQAERSKIPLGVSMAVHSSVEQLERKEQ